MGLDGERAARPPVPRAGVVQRGRVPARGAELRAGVQPPHRGLPDRPEADHDGRRGLPVDDQVQGVLPPLLGGVLGGPQDDGPLRAGARRGQVPVDGERPGRQLQHQRPAGRRHRQADGAGAQAGPVDRQEHAGGDVQIHRVQRQPADVQHRGDVGGLPADRARARGLQTAGEYMRPPCREGRRTDEKNPQTADVLHGAVRDAARRGARRVRGHVLRGHRVELRRGAPRDAGGRRGGVPRRRLEHHRRGAAQPPGRHRRHLGSHHLPPAAAGPAAAAAGRPAVCDAGRGGQAVPHLLAAQRLLRHRVPHDGLQAPQHEPEVRHPRPDHPQGRARAADLPEHLGAHVPHVPSP